MTIKSDFWDFPWSPMNPCLRVTHHKVTRYYETFTYFHATMIVLVLLAAVNQLR